MRETAAKPFVNVIASGRARLTAAGARRHCRTALVPGDLRRAVQTEWQRIRETLVQRRRFLLDMIVVRPEEVGLGEEWLVRAQKSPVGNPQRGLMH